MKSNTKTYLIAMVSFLAIMLFLPKPAPMFSGFVNSEETLNQETEEMQEQEPALQDEDIKDLTFKEIILKLNEEKVKPIYNYTLSRDYPKTEQELKEDGGDCWDWSKYWVKLVKAQGFNGYTTRMYAPTLSHMVAIVYDVDKEGYITEYCTIDTGKTEPIIKCLKMGGKR